MVNLIWFGLILIGIVVAAVEGNLQQVNQAAFEGAKEGVAICIGLISILT